MVPSQVAFETYMDRMLCMAIVLWFIWSNRNFAVFEVKCQLPFACAVRIRTWLDGWRAVQRPRLIPALATATLTWSPPPVGFDKFNVDGALLSEDDLASYHSLRHHSLVLRLQLRSHRLWKRVRSLGTSRGVESRLDGFDNVSNCQVLVNSLQTHSVRFVLALEPFSRMW